MNFFSRIYFRIENFKSLAIAIWRNTKFEGHNSVERKIQIT